MIAISNLNEVDKIIRKQLILQSEIEGDRVLNALSRYGTNLNQNVGSDIFDSISPSDIVILFEQMSRSSSSDGSFTDSDDSIVQYVSMSYHITVYGTSSATVAQKIRARFASEQCRSDLYNEGVYLERISSPQSINEYVNDGMWMRTDFDMNVSMEMKFKQVGNIQYYENSDLNIIYAKE